MFLLILPSHDNTWYVTLTHDRQGYVTPAGLVPVVYKPANHLCINMFSA